jgi:hypothetical protein
MRRVEIKADSNRKDGISDTETSGGGLRKI